MAEKDEEDWWAPSAIEFSIPQIVWLLGYLETLKEGVYPPEPKTTGYTDIGIGRKSRRKLAPFIVPSEIAAEIEIRLDKTGQDGAMVYAYYTGGVSEIEIAKLVDCPVDDVWYRINRCLKYIRGWRRKRTDYKSWITHRKGG